MKLIIVRHGQTDWNATNRFQGQADIPLNETGLLQAKNVAEELVPFEPDALFCSWMSRAKQTAEAIGDASGLTPVVQPGLEEINVGAWQGLMAPEIEEQFPEQWAAWKAGEDIHRGGGETYAECGRRGAQAFTEIIDMVPADSTVVAVAHGVLIQKALLRMIETGTVHLDGPVPHLKNTEWVEISL